MAGRPGEEGRSDEGEQVFGRQKAFILKQAEEGVLTTRSARWQNVFFVAVFDPTLVGLRMELRELNTTLFVKQTA